MSLRLTPQLRRLSTAARVHPAPPQFHTSFRPLGSSQTPSTNATSKSRSLSRWSLPTLTLLLIGFFASPLSPFAEALETSSPTSNYPNFASATANAREENKRALQKDQLQERNQHLMDNYGDRNSLEDLQKAIEGYEEVR